MNVQESKDERSRIERWTFKDRKMNFKDQKMNVQEPRDERWKIERWTFKDRTMMDVLRSNDERSRIVKHVERWTVSLWFHWATRIYLELIVPLHNPLGFPRWWIPRVWDLFRVHIMQSFASSVSSCHFVRHKIIGHQHGNHHFYLTRRRRLKSYVSLASHSHSFTLMFGILHKFYHADWSSSFIIHTSLSSSLCDQDRAYLAILWYHLDVRRVNGLFNNLYGQNSGSHRFWTSGSPCTCVLQDFTQWSPKMGPWFLRRVTLTQQWQYWCIHFWNKILGPDRPPGW